MSLYDLVLGDGGEGHRGQVFLGMLGFTGFSDVGRYRDSWAEKDPETGELVIAVYTRNGGGNRSCHCTAHPEPGCLFAINNRLTEHPLYLSNGDDTFDNTYATFRFRGPDEHKELLAKVAVERIDMSERWEAALGALRGKAASR